jgi:hypothetical protein
MTGVIRIDLGRFLLVVSFRGVVSFHEGERTGGDGVTDFGFDLTVYFSGDFDRQLL